MAADVSTETIPELLARLEQEHFAEKGSKFCYHPDHETMPEFPCDSARLVAHARSLERALTKKNKKRGFPVEGRDPERDALGVERYARS
jgi:hypothetical protein